MLALLLHPFMPFITEKYGAVDREDGECSSCFTLGRYTMKLEFPCRKRQDGFNHGDHPKHSKHPGKRKRLHRKSFVPSFFPGGCP